MPKKRSRPVDGWWTLVNLEKWNSLPKSYQSIVRAAAAAANVEQLARYDARNPQALKRLVANGVQLRPFSQVGAPYPQ